MSILSPLAVATTLSCGENWQSQTPLLCPLRVPCRARSVDLQSLTCLSWDPVAISESFGATETMFMSWKTNVDGQIGFYISHGSFRQARMLTFSCARALNLALSDCSPPPPSARRSIVAEPGSGHTFRVRSLLAVTANAPAPLPAAFPPTS